MSLTLFRWIQKLGTVTPVNAAIATGDQVDAALAKLQGQINAGGGGAGSTPTTGLAVLDFGAVPTDETTVTVAAAAVTANSIITLFPNAYGDGTADHSADEHAIEEFKLTPCNIVAGVSFDIRMTCLDRFGFLGQWSIRWSFQG